MNTHHHDQPDPQAAQHPRGPRSRDTPGANAGPPGRYSRSYYGGHLVVAVLLLVPFALGLGPSMVWLVWCAIAVITSARLRWYYRSEDVALWSGLGSGLTAKGPVRVLDLGSLDGLAAATMVHNHPDVAAFLVPSSSQHAHGIHQNIEAMDADASMTIVQAEITRLPFADNSIDLIASNWLSRVGGRSGNTPEEVAWEVARVAAPGGLVMIVVAGTRNARGLATTLERSGALGVRVDRVRRRTPGGWRLVQARLPRSFAGPSAHG